MADRITTLLERGATRVDIDRMMIENRRRFCGGQAAAGRSPTPSAKMEP